MAAKDPAQRKEIARRAGLARARQFTAESQRWAGSHQSSAARSEAGHKGAAVTLSRHGYIAIEKKIGAKYLTYLERRIVAVFTAWGWQREIDYWCDYRIDTDLTSYFVDFALPGRRYIEVSAAWVAQQEKNIARNARKNEALAQLGWRELWITEEETEDSNYLEGLILGWLQTTPAHPRKHLFPYYESLLEEIPF